MTTHTKAGTYIELIRPLGCGEWLCEVTSRNGQYLATIKEQDMRETPDSAAGSEYVNKWMEGVLQ